MDSETNDESHEAKRIPIVTEKRMNKNTLESSGQLVGEGKRNPANEHPAMRFTIVIPDWERRRSGKLVSTMIAEEGKTASSSKRLRRLLRISYHF